MRLDSSVCFHLLCYGLERGGRASRRADDVEVVEESEESFVGLKLARGGDKSVVLSKCKKCGHQRAPLLATHSLEDLMRRAIAVGPEEAGLRGVQHLHKWEKC